MPLKTALKNQSVMNKQSADPKIDIGISSCLLGERVRFDGGHKRLPFAVEDLDPFVNFIPACPEMAIGLPSPRPALRLVESADKSISLRFSKGQADDLTEKMQQFSNDYLADMDYLSGYIVCAKSPSCGMERVRVYDDSSNNNRKSGVGIFTAELQKLLPWLPIEEDGRLYDPVIKENFITRIYALHELNQIKSKGLTRHALVTFHSQYKLVLLAHSQPLYRKLGPFVAGIEKWSDLDEYFIEYRLRLMHLLSCQATRSNHTNVLMHIQGYFKKQLNGKQRQELTSLIMRYHEGTQPLLAPITLLQHYLSDYPDEYLQHQRYFTPYPEILRLRYGQ